MPPLSTSRETAWRLCVACALVAAILPLLALGNELLLDDLYTIVGHPIVRGDAPWYTVLDFDYFGVRRGTGASYGAWRPLQTLIFRLDHLLGGGAPWPFRLHSALLHGLLTAAFARALLAVAPPTATVVATALFAVHPLHTDAVFAAANRCEITALLLALGVIAAHRREGPRAALLATAAMIAASLSKESAVVILPVLALHDLAFKRPKTARLALRYALLVAVIVGAALLRRRACGSLQGYSSDPIMNPLREFSWIMQRVHGLRLFGHAASQLVAPTELASVYGPGSVPLGVVVDARLMLGAAVAAGLGWTAWRERKSAPWVSFAAAGYLVTAGAVCSVFALYSVMYAERLMLIPSAFAAALAGAAVDRLARGDRAKLALAATAGACLTFALLFALRAGDWRDPRALGRATVAAHPNDAFALALLGIWELGANNNDAGYGYCRAATDRAPRFALAWGCVGAALAARGSLEPAARAFARMEGGHFAMSAYEGQYARVLLRLGRRDDASRQLSSMRRRGLWGEDAERAERELSPR